MNVVMNIKAPEAIAYENVYEEGDCWEKIQGCEACKNPGKCCGNCKVLMSNGECLLHIDGEGKKPFSCMIRPLPSKKISYCALEFKCVKGSMIGKIKAVNSNDFR